MEVCKPVKEGPCEFVNQLRSEGLIKPKYLIFISSSVSLTGLHREQGLVSRLGCLPLFRHPTLHHHRDRNLPSKTCI